MENVRRGIDFENRLWSSGIGLHLQNAFKWWKGGKFNKATVVFIAILFFLNLYLVYPLFSRNVESAFSSTALLMLSDFFEKIGLIRSDRFFSLLVAVSLSFSPVSYYLFVRKMVLRHQLIAFLATLFFIIPNPFFPNGVPLAKALTNGDGTYAVVFSFIPLFLLYVQAFIATGASVWGVMSALGTAIIAIVSPFGVFNLLLIGTVLTISEGFLGNFRIKLLRFLFVFLTAFALSLFWYYPNVVAKIILLENVSYTLEKLWGIVPLLIPVIPVVGIFCFLVFDKREKLKAIFMGVALLLLYLFLYATSKTSNITGIFTPDRYLVTLAFAGSYTAGIVVVLLSELFIRNVILRVKNNMLFFVSVFLTSAVVTFALVLTLSVIPQAHANLSKKTIANAYYVGIGTMKRLQVTPDLSFFIAAFISAAAFLFLIFVLVRFSSMTFLVKLERERREGMLGNHHEEEKR